VTFISKIEIVICVFCGFYTNYTTITISSYKNIIEELNMKSQSITPSQRVGLAAGAADALASTATFSLDLTQETQEIFLETARFALLPISGAAALIRLILAWKQVQKESGKNGTLATALVETATTAAVGTAIIGSLVATAIFAAISPIVLVAAAATKALYHFGAASFYWIKSLFSNNRDEATTYRNKAKAHTIGAVLLTIATVALGFVLLAAKPLMAILGIFAGFTAASVSIYKLLSKPTVTKTVAVERNQRTVSADLHHRLGARVTHSVQATVRLAPIAIPVKIEKRIRFFERRSVAIAPIANDNKQVMKRARSRSL
jgi:hypothetical protein